jgi:hypothetical protein
MGIGSRILGGNPPRDSGGAILQHNNVLLRITINYYPDC